MPKFRKKAVIVEAEQWDGTEEEAERLGLLNCQPRCPSCKARGVAELFVPASGRLQLHDSDWIVRYEAGNAEICTAYAFERTYDPVKQAPPAERK